MIQTKRIASLFIILLLNFTIVFSQKNNIDENLQLKTKPNWFNLDPEKDHINGISTEKAYETILKNMKSSPVVVAIIDSGVEIDHEELVGKIWVNEKEIPNNKIDDDTNGYIDDVNGWDFLGNPAGDDLQYESMELTREYVKYMHLSENIDPAKATKQEKLVLEQYKFLKKKYEAKTEEIESKGGRFYIQLYENYVEAKKIIQNEFEVETVDQTVLDKITLVSNEKLQKAKKIFEIIKEVDLNEENLTEGYHYFNSLINYGLNTDYNGRYDIIGDNISMLNQKGYGNNEVEGPDASHGTHVAGIVAANRNNKLGISGIADNVKIMVVRAVPDGDERDKDVANGIRYAADNGAKIINMSFGKHFSPDKEYVDEALKYAESKGVLMIHGAGNDAENLDEVESYPNKYYKNNTGICQTWLEVGATSWKPGMDAVADFSNYGKKNVDIFAPGVDIYSLATDGKYDEKSGTSMAAPVVTGAAALILSYFPNLSAIELKEILMKSSQNNGLHDVYLPGKTSTTSFKNLSNTGGIVNIFQAILLAQKLTIK